MYLKRLQLIAKSDNILIGAWANEKKYNYEIRSKRYRNTARACEKR